MSDHTQTKTRQASDEQAACCDSSEQATCCEPSEKSTCCGPDQTAEGSCGCR